MKQVVKKVEELEIRTVAKNVMIHIILHGHNTIRGFESVAIPAIDFFDLVKLCEDSDSLIATQLQMINKEFKSTSVKMFVFRLRH